MELPTHPMIVHLPLALTFVLPALVLGFALMIRSKKMMPQAWLLVIGLQVLVTASGYVALETGENEEDAVEKVLDKSFINKHEEAAEVFVGGTVIALVLGIVAFFIRQELQFPVQLGIVVIGLITCYLGYRAGSLGGELVYVHGAAAAYVETKAPQGILPTPGMNTSESPFPVDENESFKKDDNDYGNGDGEEANESEDDREED